MDHYDKVYHYQTTGLAKRKLGHLAEDLVEIFQEMDSIRDRLISAKNQNDRNKILRDDLHDMTGFIKKALHNERKAVRVCCAFLEHEISYNTSGPLWTNYNNKLLKTLKGQRSRILNLVKNSAGGDTYIDDIIDDDDDDDTDGTHNMLNTHHDIEDTSLIQRHLERAAMAEWLICLLYTSPSPRD